MRLLSHLVAAVTALSIAAPAADAATGSVTPATPPAPEQPAANGPGMYRVWSCRTPSGQVAPADGWRSANQAPAAAVVSSCGSGGFLGLAVGTGTFAQQGTLEWWPAPGVEGISAELWRTATASSTQNVTSTPPGMSRVSVTRVGGEEITAHGIPGVADGTRITVNTGKTAESLQSFSLPATTRGTTHDLRAPANKLVLDPLLTGYQQYYAPIQLEAECAFWYQNYPCTTSYTIWAADLRLRDPAAPTTSNVSGPLVDALAPGAAAQSGVSGFTARAKDVGSGVLRTLIEVDGSVKAEAPASKVSATCSPRPGADGLRAYLVQVPCPLDVIVTADLDTKAIADGDHDVRLLVEDAAGNRTEVAEGKLRVNNAPRVGPGSPAELRGEANGTGAGDAARLAVVWPATGKAPSASAKTKKRCASAAYAQKHPATCRGRPAVNLVERAWSRTASEPVRIQLTAIDGTPVAGARVQLSWTSVATPAETGTLPELVTGADGSAQASVPRASGSRVVTAQWLARRADTVAAAQGTATLAVRAATSLAVARRVAPSQTVTFRGKLRGQAGARSNVPVTLEVRNQGEWKTFASASTDSEGRWSTRLRFAARPGRYPVRVQLGKTAGYPYAPSIGADTSITVRR